MQPKTVMGITAKKKLHGGA